MSLPLIDRANEIISEALNFGTISFTNGKMTTLKPDTVLNLAKAICTQKNLKAPDEITESNLPDDMSLGSASADTAFLSIQDLNSIKEDFFKPEEDKADLTQLSFPFMKHEGK